jgi:hypothetical protein
MNRYWVAALLCMLQFYSNPVSGNNLTVSIYTLDPGKDVFTLFGHSAIRIINKAAGTDRVYNFGTFDFNDPYFYFKFIRGNLKYSLSVISNDDFLYNTRMENRTTCEQVLVLLPSEAAALQRELDHCYFSPERFYTYDFFFNNCATRVRDYLFQAAQRVSDSDSISYCCKTFRQLLHPFIRDRYWLNLGINLALGHQADQQARAEDYMFLPIYIKQVLDEMRLVKTEKTIIPEQKKQVFALYLYWPWIITAAILLSQFFKYSRKLLFYGVFSVTSLAGITLLVISLISENKAFSGNLNLLWLLPSIPLIILANRKTGKFTKIAFLALLIILLTGWRHLPQEFSPAFLPWMGGMVFLLLVNLLQPLFHNNFSINGSRPV